ncbi:carboxypeptidase regulatory-like domain-containing protein [Candidatus Uhrbacteria bacterium]|nr:carboxypeptidase regulatory-like domain-containing protein [Candidatus Uhrbacteria bacterium]
MVAVLQPSVWTVGVLVLQGVVFLAFMRLAKPKKPSGWGIVYDKKSMRPISRAIVRIFEPKFNKLLETQVTDASGRYAFLVGPAEYYATYEKPEYQSIEVRPIDRTDTKESSYISLNVGMQSNPRRGETSTTEPSQ